MYRGHITTATVQKHQINDLPATSSTLISKTNPEIVKGAATNKPAKILVKPTTQDFGLSLGKKGFLESF